MHELGQMGKTSGRNLESHLDGCGVRARAHEASAMCTSHVATALMQRDRVASEPDTVSRRSSIRLRAT